MNKLVVVLLNSLLLVLLVLLSTHVEGQSSYHVNTIAGTIPYGYNGDNIDAKLAEMVLPDGVALSPSNNGDMFIVDKLNYRVRQVEASSGKIKTIVGVGFPGFVNTNIASMARLRDPSGLAFQNNDVLYISDLGNHVIFQLTLSSGLLSVFAGQPGKIGSSLVLSDGLLNTPTGIAFWNDKLFIAEVSRNVVSVVSTVDGTTSILAGGGTDVSTIVQDAKNAKLKNPSAVAVSSITGEVYIGEQGTIRKILNNGTSVVMFSTYEINGSNISSIFYAMAISPITDALYVSLSNNIDSHAVFMIQSNGTISLIAKMVVPRGIAISQSGEVFIAEGGTNKIQKVNGNTIETVAGIGYPYTYNGDNIAAVKARLYNPESVAIAPTNEVIVADTGNSRLRMISLIGIITTITTSGSVRSPLVPKLGEYYFVDSSNVYYSKSGLQPVSLVGGLNSPKGVARSNNGDLYVTEFGNNAIRKIFSNGTIITIAGNGALKGDNILATDAIINSPYGIVLTPNEEVIFSEYYGYRVRKILNNGTLITIAGTGESGYSGDNLDGVNSKLNSPAGLALLSNGELLICDSENHIIRKLFKNGTLTTIAGTATVAGYTADNTLPLEAQFFRPMGVGVNANETGIYIADTINAKIRVISFGCDLQNKCSGNGDCIMNNCSCYTGWKTSSDCSLPSCELLNACSGHGTCVNNNTCSCKSGWMGSLDCSLVSCENLNNCSGNGNCVGPNTCSCQIGWRGSLNCSISSPMFSCGKLNNCYGHGECVGNNTCVCDYGWRGSLNCSVPSCETFNNCSGRGSCSSNRTCSCLSGWKGSMNCSVFSCDGVNNCSGNGTCTASNGCTCLEGYSGLSCENRIVPQANLSPFASKAKTDSTNIGLIVGLVVGLSLLLILIVVILIITIFVVMKLKKKKNNSKVSKEETIEMVSTVDENVTQASSSQQVSDFPTTGDTLTNSYYMMNSLTSTNSPPSESSDLSLLKDRYKIQQIIGAGSFGKCYLCFDSKKNNLPVAIKTIGYDQSRQSKIIDECSKTLSYRHPNLVEVYEFFESQTIQSICIVMKYYEGDLEQALNALKQDGKIVSEKMIISIMKQLGDGLNYLHQEQLIIHRDIKPRNIFYSKLDTELDEIQVVIGDYGEAKETGDTHNSVTGTLQYMAPEVFSRKYSYGADIFSLGVSLIQAMANDTLDVNITAQLLYEKEDVVMGRILEHLISRGYSEKLCSFIVSMVAKDASERPSSADIQQFTSN